MVMMVMMMMGVQGGGTEQHDTQRETERANPGIQKKGFMLCSLCFSEVLHCVEVRSGGGGLTGVARLF